MLDRFPVELFYMIKDHIPEVDLRTHVCFAQVLGCASKTVYTDAYWERACVRFGLTISSDEDVANVSWRDFVYDIIRRDGFCAHPHCGVRRLEQNYREMNKLYMKEYTRPYLAHVLEGANPGAFGGYVATNILFANLNFSQEPHTLPIEDGFLHTHGAPREQPERSSPLSRHPIACQSFATFPPTGSAHLSTLSGIPIVRNASGVTVWDVYTAVQSRLDATDSVYRLNEYLRFVDYRKALSNRVDDITELLNRLNTLRDFFHFFRWEGLYYAGQDTEGVARFAFGFKTVRRLIRGAPEPQLIA
ncbi:hypothetical protein EUX98_g3740 [Antrodiella citrinella]|uniref:Uncharacterized protein n=1 Tax=Antrodiella citrinella TaxID=2447956 RepID=A0A4S4MVR6_9APHY|nr:hypothetical protein EUX98_g3740 [Antrodiella citrinella]